MARSEFREIPTDHSEAFDSALLACADDAVFAADPDGIIVSWNASASRLLGHTVADVLGRPVLDLVADEHLAGERVRLERVCASERVERRHVRLRCTDDRFLDVSLGLSTLHDAQGEFLGVGFIGHDISEELRETQAEDDFLSLLSHELRTPLTTILGYAQMLADPARDFDGEVRVAVGGRLLERCEVLRSILENLLSAQRLRGQCALRSQTIAPSALVQLVVSGLDECDRRRVEVVAEDASERELLGDIQWLSIALGNLLNNALKYSPLDRPVRMSVEQTASASIFEVADEGPGIPEDRLPHLFERFVQGGVEQHQGPEGVGFGLYITRRIVEAHGGTISVRTAGGAGTAFVMEIPAA